ncbi:unnamed protein product [Lactuca saligna]|uniref:Uncharacterized protein n=1 Tax=Lactuca saligna TaxID=75948 RepID=A0AA35YR90_LACSI|nr:unnamed protein product [Lactuca saligna]
MVLLVVSISPRFDNDRMCSNGMKQQADSIESRLQRLHPRRCLQQNVFQDLLISKLTNLVKWSLLNSERVLNLMGQHHSLLLNLESKLKNILNAERVLIIICQQHLLLLNLGSFRQSRRSVSHLLFFSWELVLQL